ncbi:MFS transporter [Dehalobacter sp. DCM]|uniref:MFS transporter n=1 Tax=Dehalobacter sp. DCM TaxID=2907827 RepID=UPI003081218F|nr:MFS transporter [Dehalobacter sp. DCM]
MSQETSKYKLNWVIMVGVIFAVIYQGAAKSAVPVLGSLRQVFPDASATTVQMLVTLPSLLSMLVSLISGVIVAYVLKKTLIQFGLACFLIGGIIPGFVHSLPALFFSAVLIGIGQGCLICIASSLLAENFEGNARATAMGLRQAAASIGILILTMAAGFLGQIAWYKAYYIYFFVLVIMVIVGFLLPKGKLDDKIVGSGQGLAGLKDVFNPSLVYLSILMFFLAVFSSAFFTNLGMSIMDKGLGGPAQIGIATAWNQFAQIIIGIIYLALVKLFKKYMLVVSTFLVAVGLFVLVNGPNLSYYAIGGLLFGVGCGIQFIATVHFVSETVESSKAAMALAVSMVATGLGVTVSPLIVNPITQMFGEINGTNGLLVAGVAFAIMMVVELIREVFFNKNSKIGMPIKANTESVN